MVYVTLRFEGLPAQILENAVKKGIGNTKSQVLTLGLLRLNQEYHLAEADDEELTPREVQLFEDLIEKSIKTSNFVSEKEFFAALNAKK